MTTSAPLESLDVKNQALLEGVKNGLNKKFAPVLVEISNQVSKLILNSGDELTTKAETAALISKMNAVQGDIYSDYIDSLNVDLEKIGLQQAVFEGESYNNVVIGFNSKVPAIEQVITAYSVTPLQVEDYAGNPILKNFIKDYSDKEIKRVNKAVSDGFGQGLTNRQILTNIKGTKTNRYTDGVLSKSNNANASTVRTVVQHVSTQARMETMKRNRDLVKGYKIVVTFDSRTTTLCYDIGQKDDTYKVGKGPMPPLHYGCRDTIVAALSENFNFLDEGATRASKGAKGGKQVSVKLGSYDWMLQEPKSFQEASMGVKRSKLLRDGGLTPTEYANLSTNNRFQTLTLEEMKKKQPAVFERAGVDI